MTTSLTVNLPALLREAKACKVLGRKKALEKPGLPNATQASVAMEVLWVGLRVSVPEPALGEVSSHSCSGNAELNIFGMALQ